MTTEEVKESLSTDLQSVFEVYCSKQPNPALKKRLNNPDTDWKAVLTAYRKQQDKQKDKEATQWFKDLKNLEVPETYDDITERITYLQKGITLLEQKRKELKEIQLKALREKGAAIQAQISELEAE
jgi:hypothetical protein